MKITKNMVFSFIAISFSFISVHAQQPYAWDKELVSKVIINDQNMIKDLLNELKIVHKDPINQIEIFDINKNGISDNDFLKCLPSGKLYLIATVSPKARDLFAKIPLPANMEEIGYTENIRDSETPQDKILFTLAQTMKELYNPNLPIKMYYEQDRVGIYRFELWGYNTEAFKMK